MDIMQSRRDFLAALSAAGAALVSAALIAVAGSAQAADFPEPKTSEYVIKDFAFHTGEVMPEMRVSYTTVGDPSGEPVLMLHGNLISSPQLDTSIYRVCGEVEVAGWRAGMARPSAAVGFGGAVAGAAG